MREMQNIDYGNAVSQLQSAMDNIKIFFTDTEHELFLLRNISSSKEYVDSNFEDLNYRNKIERLFYEFAKVCKHYYQIRIIDSSGYEIIGIDNKHDDTVMLTPLTIFVVIKLINYGWLT
ncbi:MAG: hypothetical protein AABY49_01100 [Planctomycetota bacterium]